MIKLKLFFFIYIFTIVRKKTRRDLSKEIHLDNNMDIPGNRKTDGKKSKTKGKKKDHEIENINDSVSKSTTKAKRINENDDDKNTKKPKRNQKDKQPEQLEQNQNNQINIYDEDEPFLQQTPTTTKDSKGKRKSISINDPSISNNITQVTHDKIISPSPPPQTPNVIPLTDNLDDFDINSTSMMIFGTNSSDLPATTRNSNDDDIDMDKRPQDKIKKLPNGLIVEDKKIGTGNSAKTGNRVIFNILYMIDICIKKSQKYHIHQPSFYLNAFLLYFIFF